MEIVTTSIILGLFGILITVTLAVSLRGNNKRLDDTIKRLETMETANASLKDELITANASLKDELIKAITSAVDGLERKMDDKFSALQSEVKENNDKITKLSEGVAVLKDRSDRAERVALIPNESVDYRQDHKRSAENESVSEPVQPRQETSTRTKEDLKAASQQGQQTESVLV